MPTIPDPYITLDEFVEALELGDTEIVAATCAATSYGDQWDRMDALLAEGLPWPHHPLQTWDRSLEMATIVGGIMRSGIPAGALMFPRGATAYGIDTEAFLREHLG